jgi:TRAP-type C4-dicarboxylate transport system substrate-binding protein
MKRGAVLGALAAILLAGADGPQTAAAQQPIVIKLGNVHQVDLPIQVGLKRYADKWEPHFYERIQEVR